MTRNTLLLTPRRTLPALLLSFLALLLLATGCATVDEARTVETAPAPSGATESPATESTATEPPATEPTAADGFDPSTAPLDAEIPIASEVRHGRLDNGLRYLIRENERPEDRAELRLAIDAGSILEEEDQLGLAHFLEHMAFNGTENFEKQELVSYLQTIGMRFGADVNAYTSFDETVYMLTLPTDDPEIVQKAFLILADWADRIALDPTEVDAERGVVVEEWRLSRGAGMRVFDKQLPVVYHGSLYPDRLPIGTKESIETAPREALERFYRDWYRPELMAVIAVGDFDAGRVEELIRGNMESMENPPDPPERTVEEIPFHQESLVSIETDPELTSTRVSVLFKHPDSPEGTVGAYRRNLVERLHSTMFNARLGEIAQQDDPPFVFAGTGSGSLGRTASVYQLQAMVREGRVEDALETLLTEAERVDRHGFTESELERAKTNLLRSYEQMYAERDKSPSAAFAAELIRHFLQGESVPGIEAEMAMARRFVPEIGLDEINHLGEEWITEENRVLLVSAPQKDGESQADLPAEETLLALFDEVDGRELEPWLDRTSDEPLVAETPEPGEVVAEQEYEAIGVTEWTLSNGVRVVLKPTDFQNDQVLLSASSPGGTSLASLEDLPSARFATSLLGQSGLGAFDSIELEKVLAGEVASARASIGELEESIEGSASPQDLETLLQLVYLHFTAPRIDDEAAKNFVDRMSAMIENRRQRPETFFFDEYRLRSYDDHPRRQPLTPEMLQAIDPDRALEIYRERFADASDFTVFLVGNFEPGEIRPLVETWIGSLEDLDREESWKDVDADLVEGVTRFDVRKGLEPKSMVRLQFHGDAEWSRESSFLFDAMARILQVRFIELVREDLGLTYSVSVGGGISWRPEESYDLVISFGCNPTEVQTLVDALFAEMETMARDGVDPELVAKVKENLRREREVDLKENRFWAGVLSSYYDRGQDPELILDYDALLDTLTPESAQEALQTWIDRDQYILGVLYPEEIELETPTPTKGASASRSPAASPFPARGAPGAPASGPADSAGRSAPPTP